jgi:lipoic acid synthetase
MQGPPPEKPPWLKVKLPRTERYGLVKGVLSEMGVNTVCASSKCPNAFECWDSGTLTFMVLGKVCTRSCRFCAVEHGRFGEKVDPAEPSRVAEAAKRLGLSYIIITSVDRDDLEDYGAGHFADCIKEVKRRIPHATVEAIIPDFSGSPNALQKVIEAGPDVIAHNVETVERLTPLVRDRRAGYWRSIGVLGNIRQLKPSIATKSSLMLGLGEEEAEVKETIRSLREAGVDILILGQYLCPGGASLPVHRYLHPDEFKALREFAVSLGFRAVAAGPFMRSSYRSSSYFSQADVHDRR